MKNKFTKSEILEAFYFADMAHSKSEDELIKTFGNNVFVIDPFVKGIGDACIIIKDGEQVIVAFPGSKDIVHWVLNFYKYDNPESGVHPGMLVLIESMAEQILTKVMSLAPKKILITGISRGGGVADVFLETYSHLLDVPADCMTFAQPCVFTDDYYKNNFSMKDAKNVRYLRVAMANDLVPKIPQSKYGYKHKGDALNLGLKMPWYKQLKLTWKLWRDFDKFVVLGLHEHNKDVYFTQLKALPIDR